MIDAMISILRAEPRTALIAVVEISLEGPAGVQLSTSARMEDRSPSGACVRVKAPIPVGATVKVSGRWERFSGVAKYCHRDGWEYVVGIQRQSTDEVHISEPPQIGLQQEMKATSGQPDLRHGVEIAAKQEPDHTRSETEEAQVQGSIAPIIPAVPSEAVAPQAAIGRRLESMERPRISQDVAFGASSQGSQNSEIQTQQPSPGKKLGKERTDMSTKWLDTAFKRQKQDVGNGKSNGAHAAEHRAPLETAVAISVRPDEALKARPRPQGDLPPMEDVYRAAGIMTPRMGYSITKVVEMVNSDHMRGLSNDAKRAALLMALDAAGISNEEVLRDGARRKDALDAYEADQQRLFEATWARKAEGNEQIQAEMERVTAQYLERIQRNLDEIAAERTALARWQAMKQLEAQRMSEAAGLISQSAPSEARDTSLLERRGLGSSGKPS
jgi:hypothetical protein